MSEDFSYLTDSDFELIESIVDGSLRRLQGENILAAVEAADKACQEPHPLLEALDRAHRVTLEDEQE